MPSVDFFREITLRVCSSLDIRVSINSCFDFLRQHLPLDHLFLNIHDAQLGAIRQIAHATSSDEECREKIIPLPKDIWEWARGFTEAQIFDSAKETPITKRMAALVKRTEHSDLAVPLIIEEQRVGVLILRANGSGRYSQKDADLIQSVREPFAIALANALAHEELLRYQDILLDDNSFYRKELAAETGDTVVGATTGLRHVMEAVHQVTSLNNTVLLLGETGVGKEIVANAIHLGSSRKNAPFIKVNCGAIPDSLIDSELFGHDKGAFTGAVAEKRGRFERADGGTLFLDEIGELPLPAQARLLRVLQTKELERVGGTKTIPVDIRVIAATHRNLEQMIKENHFREDLWFRINAFPIYIPPLRQRLEDIPALTRRFVETKSKEFGVPVPAIAPGALESLVHYEWPGNVRELQNVVEREIIRCRGEALTFDSLPQTEMRVPIIPPTKTDAPSMPINLDQAMARHIENVISMAKGKISGPGGAAELMGVNPTTLRSRMTKLGVRGKKSRLR
jgi:transcriptional regulator with GAF, ATPase, and Fis domain